MTMSNDRNTVNQATIPELSTDQRNESTVFKRGTTILILIRKSKKIPKSAKRCSMCESDSKYLSQTIEISFNHFYELNHDITVSLPWINAYYPNVKVQPGSQVRKAELHE